MLQYVLVKPTCALITFVSGAAGIYGSHTFSLARLHFYVFFVSSTSQVPSSVTLAFACSSLLACSPRCPCFVFFCIALEPSVECSHCLCDTLVCMPIVARMQAGAAQPSRVSAAGCWNAVRCCVLDQDSRHDDFWTLQVLFSIR